MNATNKVFASTIALARSHGEIVTRAGMVAIVLLLPLVARAEPITLKLSFYTSDRSVIYQNSIKPFVDAVNRDGKELIEIKVDFSSAITRPHPQMPQLVADGRTDMAHIVPGLTPSKFGDTAVMELPGLIVIPARPALYSRA